jgi:hypothetical protein
VLPCWGNAVRGVIAAVVAPIGSRAYRAGDGGDTVTVIGFRGLIGDPVPAQPKEAIMTTVLIFHEVDEVEHWLDSPRREEVFGPVGISIQTFIDPTDDHRVGLIVDVPDMDVFQRMMASTVVAEAMHDDGVRPETIVMMVES